MPRTRRFAAPFLVPLLLVLPCAHAVAAPAADALTARFAAMDDSGWTGADASWSVALPDGRIAWLFGDTFIGGVDHDGCRRRSTPVVRNSIVVQNTDGSMETVVGGDAEHPEALIPGKGPDDWYWPGPPVLGNGELQVPMAHIVRTGGGDWDVAAVGTSLATFGLDDLRPRSVVPLVTPPHVNMASAAVTSGGFTYIYGTRDYPGTHKDAYVARVRAGNLAGRWRYWNGRRWSHRAANAAAVASGVSNQFSVINTVAGWRLVTQLPMRREILALKGPSPAGPWVFNSVVTQIPDIPGAVTYNATVHPEFSGDGWWVVGFSVNGRGVDEVFDDADLYKPRFLTIRIP